MGGRSGRDLGGPLAGSGPRRRGALARRVQASGAVDVHVHLTPLPPPAPTLSPRRGLRAAVTALTARMDAAGVSHALYLAEQFASPARSLEWSRRAERLGKGRLLGSVTVDPTRRRKDTADTIAAWSRAGFAVRAVKLYPGYQPFSPADLRAEPVLEWAAEHRLPVFLHAGDVGLPSGRLRYAHPLEVDEVAVRFRSVQFVICHLATPWVEEAATVARKNPNVWLDSSGLLDPFSPYARRVERRMEERLQLAVDTLGGTDRLLFGSDWPNCDVVASRDLVRHLDVPLEDQVRILRTNADRLLGLSDPPRRRGR